MAKTLGPQRRGFQRGLAAGAAGPQGKSPAAVAEAKE